MESREAIREQKTIRWGQVKHQEEVEAVAHLPEVRENSRTELIVAKIERLG